MPFTQVFPTAFTLSDGVQTLTNLNSFSSEFFFATGPTGAITMWTVVVVAPPGGIPAPGITTTNITLPEDVAFGGVDVGFGTNLQAPGVWSLSGQVPDTGSTLSLMTLTLMALGLVARRFQRPAVWTAPRAS
jgi:hypothetical protein